MFGCFLCIFSNKLELISEHFCSYFVSLSMVVLYFLCLLNVEI